MIYKRLRVVLLSTIASEKEGSTNQLIASFVLQHADEVQNMGIRELADACHVGIASISRFCRDIGLRGYDELKKLLNEGLTADRKRDESLDLAETICTSLRAVTESIDLLKIKQLAIDIRKYDKVSAFGLLKAGTAAISLQADLSVFGKEVYTAIPYGEQMNHIQHAGKDELIVLFSYTGSYFDDHSFRPSEKHLLLPRIVMFTGNKDHVPWYVDETILFSSDQSLEAHPWQLLLCETLLVKEYAALTGK